MVKRAAPQAAVEHRNCFPRCRTPQFSGRRQAPKAAVDAPLELLVRHLTRQAWLQHTPAPARPLARARSPSTLQRSARRAEPARAARADQRSLQRSSQACSVPLSAPLRDAISARFSVPNAFAAITCPLRLPLPGHRESRRCANARALVRRAVPRKRIDHPWYIHNAHCARGSFGCASARALVRREASQNFIGLCLDGDKSATVAAHPILALRARQTADG